MNEISTIGIIISVMPIGEFDRRIEILTSSCGRISAFARGSRKAGSSLVSATRVFAFGEFILRQGKNSYSLKSASIKNYFEELSSELEISCYGFYFLELAQYFSRENVEASNMLRLLYYSLKELTRKRIPYSLIKSIYELKLLQLNGLCPDLQVLMNNPGEYSFAANISESCRKAYNHVIFHDVNKQFTFLLSADMQEEFSQIVKQLLGRNVDKKFKSLELIQ